MEEQNKEQPQEQNLEGSLLKKFKDVKSLENAYENLEKEFTRKSQLLSQMQKNELNNEQKCDISCEKEEKTDEFSPIWEKDEWNKSVSDFLDKNPNASKYATEICDIILKDKDVQSSSQPLLSAYTKFLESNFKTKDEIFLDENSLQEITKNQKVRDAVIKDYLHSIKNRNYVPPVFLNKDGGGIAESAIEPPKTLEEAKELVKKILINKGE